MKLGEKLMKMGTLFQSPIAVLAAAFVALPFLPTAIAGNHSTEAHVESIKGAAHYSTDTKVWLPLKVHSTLKSGTLVKTGQESTVRLVFKEDGSAVTANPDTVVRIARMSSVETGLEVVSETDLDLIEGSLNGTQTKNSVLSHFKINLQGGFALLEQSDYWACSETADKKVGSFG